MSLTDRLQNARSSYFASRQRQLRERGQWADALAMLVDEAAWLSGEQPRSARWITLLIEATEIASHLDDPAEYRAFLAYFADHLLGDDEAGEQAIIEALPELEGLSDAAVLHELGAWLTLARHRWPLGPYLQGHALEVGGINAGADASLRDAVEAFERAARRAETLGKRRFERHCRLRQAALRLQAGIDRSAAYTVLSQLNWSAFSAHEQLWMARALTHSERWIDRVRAIDLLLDLRRELETLRVPSVNLDLLRVTARELLSNAPLRLHASEADRLPELLSDLFDEDEASHWRLHLDAREQLQHLGSSPIDEPAARDQALERLQTLATDAPSRWQPVAQHLSALLVPRAAGEQALSRTAVDPTERFYDVLSATLQSLSDATVDASRLSDLASAGEALGEDAGALRALAMFWPAFARHAKQDALSDLGPALTRVAELHARGPSPSYGWWSLAAHLYELGLPKCAWPLAGRALNDPKHSAEDDIYYYVKSKSLKEAASRKDAAAASRWLELTR